MGKRHVSNSMIILEDRNKLLCLPQTMGNKSAIELL